MATVSHEQILRINRRYLRLLCVLSRREAEGMQTNDFPLLAEWPVMTDQEHCSEQTIERQKAEGETFAAGAGTTQSTVC